MVIKWNNVLYLFLVCFTIGSSQAAETEEKQIQPENATVGLEKLLNPSTNVTLSSVVDIKNMTTEFLTTTTTTTTTTSTRTPVPNAVEAEKGSSLSIFSCSVLLRWEFY